MQASSNRSIVVVSGLLTLLILGGGTLAVAFHNGWLQVRRGTQVEDAMAVRAESAVAPVLPSTEVPQLAAAPPEGAARDDLAIYRNKLEEAYRALDDAYAQIRSLQAAQTQIKSVSFAERGDAEHGDDDHHEGRRGHVDE